MKVQRRSTRLIELDVLRAILIFFVVFGHSQCCLDQAPLARELVYSFHMPAMFTLSGLVTALSWKRWKGNVGGKIGRSARRLLIPYLLCGLVLFPVWVVFWDGGGLDVFKQSWSDCLLHNHGFWYLPACFLLGCSYVLVAKGKAWLCGRGPVCLRRPLFSWSVSCLVILLVLAGSYVLTHCDFLRSALAYWFSYYAGVALASRPRWVTAPRIALAGCGLLVWMGLAPIFAAQPHTLVGNVIKPFTGLAALFPLAYVSHIAKLIPGLARVGESTLVVYCVEGIVGWRFFTTASPSNVWGAVLWSLILILAVHGLRFCWVKCYARFFDAH